MPAPPRLFTRKTVSCFLFFVCPVPCDLLFLFLFASSLPPPPAEVELPGRMVPAVRRIVQRVRPVEKKRLRSTHLGDGDQTVATFFSLFVFFLLSRFSPLFFLSLAWSFFYVSGGGGGGGEGVEGIVGRGDDDNRRKVKDCRRNATFGR